MSAGGDWVKLFPQGYVPVILEDVLVCSQCLERPPPSEKRPEEALTRQIFLRLCRLKTYREGPLEPHIESWLSDLEHRSDIRFSCGKGIETYFLVEAKRLYVTFPGGKKESLIGKYIDDGMMRFVKKDYAPYQESSAMLAYVYDAKLPEAQQAVAKHINDKAEKLCVCKGFGSSMNTVNLPIHETHHDLKNKKFTLFHLFTEVVPEILIN